MGRRGRRVGSGDGILNRAKAPVGNYSRAEGISFRKAWAFSELLIVIIVVQDWF
jgi:hypothetical protein